MPTTWCDESYARDALMPYDQTQVSEQAFTPAIQKAMGWVRAFISPQIAAQADSMASLPDYSSLKLCTALFAAYYVVRAKFMGRAPNQNPWVEQLKTDAEKLLDLIKLNPQKALGGTSLSDAGYSAMGLQSSKQSIVPTGTLLSEIHTQIDPDELDKEADERDTDAD